MRPSSSRATRTRLPRALAAASVAVIALLVVSVRLANLDGVPLGDLLRDPATTHDAPFHVGLVSNAGVLLWCVAAVCCLFAARVAPRRGVPEPDRRFLLGGAALSAWLMLDDALLLHEQVLPDYLGLPDTLGIAIAALGTLAFVLGCRRAILASDYPVLVAALAFLATSAALDGLADLGALGALFLHSSAVELVVEDTAKLVGIALWATYFVGSADRLVAARP